MVTAQSSTQQEATPPQRTGVLIDPVTRLSTSQEQLIDEVSRTILEDPGLFCYNQTAAELFKQAGATVEDADGCVRIRIPSAIIDKALASAPSTITLGARNPDNKLVLDAHEPRVRFGSGSETNVWLDVSFDEQGRPRFDRLPGSIERLRRSAHLCEHLEHLDFFIRNVNIQDDEVTAENKDVNKFLASFSHITKHVQAGLTDINRLDDVIRLGEIIAGGAEAFKAAPPLSFITCVIKSPLQMVDDTAEKLIAIARREVPVVISSCPMGGATGAFDEFGMVAQINAELLAGVTLNQLAQPGAPVLYGAVPVRTRLDNLNDMYGAPEFNQYNMDCVQMARYYGLPCYSTAGVGDASTPGIQATAEKLLTLASVPLAGAQYIHYAFGLLERTNVFCPEQAVMDNAHIGAIKQSMKPTTVQPEQRDDVIAMIRDVAESDHQTFMYHLPLPTRESVYVNYPLESEHGALYAAHEEFKTLSEQEPRRMPEETLKALKEHIPGILPQTLA